MAVRNADKEAVTAEKNTEAEETSVAAMALVATKAASQASSEVRASITATMDMAARVVQKASAAAVRSMVVATVAARRVDTVAVKSTVVAARRDTDLLVKVRTTLASNIAETTRRAMISEEKR